MSLRDGIDLDATFAALSDPVRREILRRLAEADQLAGALAEPFEVSRPAISRHLRVLRDAGLVNVRIDGRHRWFSLNAGGVTDAQAWLDDLRSSWRESLFELKSFVERS